MKKEVNKQSKNRLIKEELINEISNNISKSKSLVVWEYLGIGANEISDLRKKIRNVNALNKVYKNTLAKIAFEKNNKTEVLDVLKGSSSFLFTFDDNADSLKLLSELAKKNKLIKFKAGYVDGIFYDAAKIQEIAGLPSKPELLSQLLSVLQANIKNLAYGLKQVADSKTE